MRLKRLFLISGLHIATMQVALAQGMSMTLPKFVEAGRSFSIQNNGSGKATLYIIGPGQVLKREVQLGETSFFSAGSLFNAGHYVVILAGDSSTKNGTFDVTPASTPAELSFLAKPSRLPVDLKGGITGAAYVFDAYHNLILTPASVSFELSSPGGNEQEHAMMTHNGAAWTAMDSTTVQGTDRFVARLSDISRTRIVDQVPGDPCALKMSAERSGRELQLKTDPVRDCNGNAVPDGTIVTFTETYNGGQSTVDVPLKRGIAMVRMPDHIGATISVASGVVLGNQIRWEK